MRGISKRPKVRERAGAESVSLGFAHGARGENWSLPRNFGFQSTLTVTLTSAGGFLTIAVGSVTFSAGEVKELAGRGGPGYAYLRIPLPHMQQQV